jgi:hypothetical protein
MTLVARAAGKVVSGLTELAGAADLGKLSLPSLPKSLRLGLAGVVVGCALDGSAQDAKGQVLFNPANIQASLNLGASLSNPTLTIAPTVTVVRTNPNNTTTSFSGMLVNTAAGSTVMTAQHGLYGKPTSEGYSYHVVVGSNANTGVVVNIASITHATYNGTTMNGSIDLSFLRLDTVVPTAGF